MLCSKARTRANTPGKRGRARVRRLACFAVYFAVALPGLLAAQRSHLADSGQLSGVELPDENVRWLEVASPNFTVISDAKEKQARKVAEDLERLAGLLSRLRAGASASKPTLVFAFREPETFRRYSPWPDKTDLAGFYSGGWLRNYITVDISPRTSGLGVIYHEYLHHFANDNFPEVPLWFNEGLAEYYSTFRVARERAEVGRPRSEHLAWLRANALIPMRELLRVTEQSPLYNEAARAGLFYAQTWAFVHYLLSDSERLPKVNRFFDLLRTEEDVDRAFSGAFGGSYDELGEELESYVEGRSFTYFRVPLASLPATEIKVRSLPRSRALSLLGELLVGGDNPRIAQAQRHFEKALELDPREALAQTGLALVHYSEGELESGIERLQTAARASQEPLPHLALGLFILEKLGREAAVRNPNDEQRELVQQARRALTHAIASQDGWTIAQVALGVTYVYDGDLQEGVDQLRRAARLTPSSTRVSSSLAILAAAANDYLQAWRIAYRAQQLEDQKPARFAQQSVVARARTAVGWLHLEEALELYNSGNELAALGVLESVRPHIEGPGFEQHRAQYGELLGAASYNLTARRLNTLAEQANGGQLEETLDELDVLEEDASLDEQLRSVARTMAASIRESLARNPR